MRLFALITAVAALVSDPEAELFSDASDLIEDFHMQNNIRTVEYRFTAEHDEGDDEDDPIIQEIDARPGSGIILWVEHDTDFEWNYFNLDSDPEHHLINFGYMDTIMISENDFYAAAILVVPSDAE